MVSRTRLFSRLTSILALVLMLSQPALTVAQVAPPPNRNWHGVSAPLAVSLSATKAAQLAVDNNNNGEANLGDTLKYTVITTNSGSTDALEVSFFDNLDANTTLVPGSVRTTGLAINDWCQAIGNVRISPNAANSLLANRRDADGPSTPAPEYPTVPLWEVEPPSISKAFGASTISVGETTSLTFTITNTNMYSSLTGVAFTDNMPTHLVVANPANVTNNCGGSVTATPGTNMISLSNGTLTPSQVCQVTINVVSAVVGRYDNTTGAVSSNESGAGDPSNTATLNVTCANTTTKLDASPNPSIYGQSVTFTTTVTSTVGTPTGVVTFTLDTTNITRTLSGGIATYVTSTLTVGTHPITVTYGGDTNYNGSMASGTQTVNGTPPMITSVNNATFPFGTPSSFTVMATGIPTPTLTQNGALPGGVTFSDNGNGTGALSGTPTTAGSYPIIFTASNGVLPNATQPFTLTVTKANTTTKLDVSPNPSIYGQSVTFTATVTSTVGAPTGVVMFTLDTTNITRTLSSGTATYITSTLTAGTHPITATYGGDTNYNGSTVNGMQTVSQASTTTKLDASPNPSILEQSVTFTATVTQNGGAGAAASKGRASRSAGDCLWTQGTVQFTDGTTNLGTRTLDSNCRATLTTAFLIVGTHYITATFSGDTNYIGSTDSLQQRVEYPKPTITEISPTFAPVNGAPFTLVITGTGFINNQSVIRWSGSDRITWFVSSTQLTTTIQMSDLAAAGTITVTVFNPTPGGGEASPPLIFTIGQGNTQTRLISSGSPSAWLQSVTFTATVTQTFGVTRRPRETALTGVVTFTVDTATITRTLSGGVATYVTDTLSVGMHYIIATYSGDANFSPSTSDLLPHLVNKANTRTTLTSSLNPSVVGQSVTFAATVELSTMAEVTALRGRAPRSAVCVWMGEIVDFKEGTATLGSGALNASCVATYTTSSLAVGTHYITATYRGDTNYNGSTSPPLPQVVNPTKIYLPLIQRNYASGPDLIVQSISATTNDIQVVIQNIGDQPVVDEFWVDVYINPNPVPTRVNQIWPMLSSQGLVWGVTFSALPLMPGQTLTLRIGDDYYWPSLSNVSFPLARGTVVYAQADSANAYTNYGAVLENHEIAGNPYDNINWTTVEGAGAGRPPVVSPRGPESWGNLPPRPRK